MAVNTLSPGYTLTHKDKQLAYQPFFDNVKKFETMSKAKGISLPFSYAGFESVLATNGLVNTLIDGMADNFRIGANGKLGEESLADAYKSCVKHALQEHSNPFTEYMDVNGNAIGLEGYGATAITGNHNMWSRLNPVVTAGYLARSRSIEFYQVIHDDDPTFWRQYSVDYVMKGLDGERFVMPRAIRAGQVAGMLDLPLCIPKVSGDSPNISNIFVDAKNSVTKVSKSASETSATGSKIEGFIEVGTSGNLMTQGGFDASKHSLEQRIEVDYVHVVFIDEDESSDANKVHDMIVKTRIDRALATGDTAERPFNEVVNVYYKNSAGMEKLKKVPISAVINLDTSDYRIMSDGIPSGAKKKTDGTYEYAATGDEKGIVKHLHFKVRVTNVANEMETLMNGQVTKTMTFNVENKAYGSIPVIPEMNADFNAGGENVSWVAFMTDHMTENYSGIRDLDSEAFIDENYEYHPRDFELSFKLGGFKYSGSFPVIPTKPGGSDDLLATTRQSMRHFMTRIFTRCEKFTNFDKNIERQWIIMANDEDVDFLPEVSWQNATSEMTGNEGVSTFRFGFSLDDNYGWIDSFSRRVRIIGSKDERWLGRPITAAMKTTTIAAPTMIYFPYMFRVFSGISPEMRNRPALLFASRDTRRCSTLVQSRISLEGNDLALYSNQAAFAAGYAAVGPQGTGYKEVGTQQTGFGE